MALSDELAYMSATELALRIRRRDLSPVEVVDACLGRIEARNPSITAFVHGADLDQRRGGGPPDRLVPDLFHQLLGPPRRIDSGGLVR